MSTQQAHRLAPELQDSLDTPRPVGVPHRESAWVRVSTAVYGFTHQKVRIVATSAKGDERQSAQWPIAAIIVTVALALFTAYREFNRDTSFAATNNATEITSLKKDVEFLRDENRKKDAAILSLQEDYKVLDATLGQYRVELATKGKINLTAEEK